ncbi:MAG: CPBP family intramembrane metalloprotease [Candidatus Thorarchaeota archaeon]|nr:CPBP family intramembrane metalloprotease [Candidatus Thorarchaeota archaeon]
MFEERAEKVTRIILFSFLMLLIIEMPHVLSAPLLGTEAYESVASLLSLMTFPLMFFAALQLLKWEGGDSVTELGLKTDRNTWPHLIIGGIAGGAAAALVFLIALVFGGQVASPSLITEGLVVSVIIIAIPVSFVEELAYRGYMMTRMTELWGRNKGIVISSLVFAFLHFSWWAPLGSVPVHLIILFTFNLLVGGVVLSLGYYYSHERLWVPIGFHFAWNIVAYAAFPVYPREPVINTEIFQIEWGITTVLGFLFGLSIIWLILKRSREKRG